MFGFGKKKELIFGIPGLDFVKDAELEHTIIPATTGSGKTVTLHHLLNRILAGVDEGRNEKALIADNSGHLMSTRGDLKVDKILNPFDARSLNWNPFNEIENEWDYDSFSASMIPEDGFSGQEADFRTYAQGLLSNLMKGVLAIDGKRDPRLVQRLISCPDPEALKPYCEGTSSSILLEAKNDRFLGSVQGVAAKALKSWSVLKSDGDFSIRKWVREGKGCLFLTYKESHLDSLRPIIGAWLSLGIKEVLSLPQDDSRRVWMIMDELDSLGTVADLSNALTKGRKNGLATIATIQTLSQLKDRYGENGSETLLSCFVNKLIMRQGSHKDAEYWSKELGQQEVVRKTPGESLSAGIGSARKTVSSTETQQVQQLVLPSELMPTILQKFCGYASLSGYGNIRRFKVEPQDFKAVNPDFVA
jgi:type IV secretory pathway TraG/TraD family ATPase VirD4